MVHGSSRGKIKKREAEVNGVLEKLGAYATNPIQIVYHLSSDLGKETHSLRKKISNHIEELASEVQKTKRT